jgi:CTP synthase (UTP-ammonia lyase)
MIQKCRFNVETSMRDKNWRPTNKSVTHANSVGIPPTIVLQNKKTQHRYMRKSQLAIVPWIDEAKIEIMMPADGSQIIDSSIEKDDV